jgi:hypothetical protein
MLPALATRRVPIGRRQERGYRRLAIRNRTIHTSVHMPTVAQYVCTLVMAVVCASATATHRPARSRVIAITRVSIIDTKGGPTLRNVTVVIQEGRISAITKNGKVRAVSQTGT